MAYPWFKFFVADWDGPELRACSLATRGFYVGCKRIMEYADPPGFLIIRQIPVKISQDSDDFSAISLAVGCTQQEAKKHLSELIKAGIFEVTKEGEICCPETVKRCLGRKQANERMAKYRETHANGPASRDASHPPSRDASHQPSRDANVTRRKDLEEDSPPLDPQGGVLSPPPWPGDGPGDGLEAGLETALPAARGGIPCPMPARFPFASDRAWAKRFWTKHDRLDLVAQIDVEVVKFQAHYGKRDAHVANWGEAWRYWVAETMNRTRKANGHNGLSGHDALDAGIELARQLYAQHEAEQAAGIVDVQRNDRPPAHPRPALSDQRERPEKARDPDG